MMTSVSIVREKETGTMEILLVSPVRPMRIVTGKARPLLCPFLYRPFHHIIDCVRAA